MKVFLTSSARETQQIAKKFTSDVWKRPRKSTGALVIGLKGDLGSGKTTFVQGVAHALGVREKVLSPTFVIIKKYRINFPLRGIWRSQTKFKYLYHIDCYRIESEEDILKLGWDAIVSDPQNLVLVEWPERIEKILPKDTILISFKATNENERKISFA